MLSELKTNPNNVKSHTDAQIEVLSKLMKNDKIGFNSLLLIDENNMIIAGHARYEAAKLAGITKVPCIKYENLTEEEKKKLMIMDNQSSISSWDNEKLKIVLEDIGPKVLEDEYDVKFNLDTPEIDIPLENESINFENEITHSCIVKECNHGKSDKI